MYLRRINIYLFRNYYINYIIFSLLEEMNRTDFSEGKSEIVLCFNIEFKIINFIFVLMSEYVKIIFIGIL